MEDINIDDVDFYEKDSLVGSPVSNYYGSPFVGKGVDGKYYISIENWESPYERYEISHDFYSAWVKEFSGKKVGV